MKAKNRLPPLPEFRNKFEERFCKEFILPEVESGEIVWWGYECLRFKLADRTTYLPDFMVQAPDGSMSMIETKGSWKAKGAAVTRVKLKTCAELYHMYDWYGVTHRKGKWVWEEF